MTASRTHARWRLSLELGGWYVASWLVGIGFGKAVELTGTWAHGASWEREMLRWFHERPLPLLLDDVMLATPYLGTNLTMLPLMLAVGLLLWKKFDEPLIAVQLLLISIGSLSLNPTMKYLLSRPRPALYPLRGMWTWASYPSGHLILTTALYFTVSMMLLRTYRWRWPFAVAAFIVLITGYSRLYLSVHWPTDLIGGELIGIVWLFGTWMAFARYRAAVHVPDLAPHA
ncbi:MAG: Phosphoesterase, PA-phosphatase related protein [Gemmatimonadetes bacterium]|nr:Phosphoesterase, PA-phosphatase related protein [Gemmatimonadota bacterium]